MNSDWDDAPDYLREPKRPNDVGRLFVACVLGVGVTCLALYVASISFTAWDASEQKTVVQAQPAELDENLRAMIDAPLQSLDRSAEEAFWKDAEFGKKQPKQTVFNDSNYVPRQPQNIVSTEAIRSSEAYQRQTTQPVESSQKTASVERTAEWIEKWGGGGRYLAEWKSINNRIDSTSVCANHRRGSIDYRECRKGAKQFFKKECRGWGERYDNSRSDHSYRMRDRYCSAANSFSPMG